MTDSPRHLLPIDTEERPIEGRLLEIRNQLELLKRDKSCYVKSDDVLRLYKETVEQVKGLNELRDRKQKTGEQNRVDTLCDDCFQLISLGFMTIGKNNDAPGIYSVVSTIKRLSDHLKEAAFYSARDLDGMSAKLSEFRSALQRCQKAYDPELLELIERRIIVCENTLDYLRNILSHLTPELAPYWEKLVSILRRLSNLNTRSRYSKEEHNSIQREIEEIKAKLPELVPQRSASIEVRYEELIRAQVDAGQASPEKLVGDLFERCVLWSEVIRDQPLFIDESFRELYSHLKSIRDNLESRSLLQSWSLRETDLYDYQRRLDRIDENRTEDGNFVSTEGKKACLQTQRTLLYLLRKSYALIYLLLTSSEPVSEALLPIHNQLKTAKKCLREVQKAGGVSSPRELYPYTMKLSSIDNMQTNGKFMVNGDAPDGQSVVISLLHECWDLAHQLRAQAQDNEAREKASSGSEVKVPVVPSAA